MTSSTDDLVFDPGPDDDLDLDAGRTCGFDGHPCPSEDRCHADRTCHREDDLAKEGWCTECDPIRRFVLPGTQVRDLRSLKAHMSKHRDREPCPNSCGRDFKPGSGMSKHLRTCGLVVTPGEAIGDPDTSPSRTFHRRDRREIPLIGGGTVVIVLHLDDKESVLDLARPDRAFVMSLFDLADEYLAAHPPIQEPDDADSR